jgi:SAM-dependent methyltransferase
MSPGPSPFSVGLIGSASGFGSAFLRDTTYAVEAEIEATHWWFVGRRRLFRAEIERLGLPSNARTLDVGTGTGTNLRLLRDMGYSDVVGLDTSEEAARFCRDKGLGEVRLGDVCALPFGDGCFDLVMATDIVEHVDNDQAALDEIVRVLAPGGRALVTVPAFQALWGTQDEIGMHKRRYVKECIKGLVTNAGMTIREEYYFNYILFLPIWLIRWGIARSGVSVQNENNINGSLINLLLKYLFIFDVCSACHLRPPFGVSILVIAEKPA